MNLSGYIAEPLPIEKELDAFFTRDQALVIFDIGACEGEDSIRYRRRFPAAKIYSFEPLKKNADKLRKNFSDYGVTDIEMFPLALSDKNGKAVFYVSTGTPPNKVNDEPWDYGNKSSSLLRPTDTLRKEYAWLEFKEEVEVQTARLDSFCAERNIGQIDFIHLDVQGAELMVLEGAGSLISSVRTIWLEVENVELYSGQPLRNDIENFLTGNGFIKVKDTAEGISGDQFYVNSRFLSPLQKLKFKFKNLLRSIGS